MGSETPHHWQKTTLSRGVVLADSNPVRRMRGDYEPVDVLVFVFHKPWARSLRTLVDGLAGAVDIQVLYPDESRAARRFRRQTARPCVDPRYMSVDTPWIRDYGPLQVFEHGKPQWLDYGYAEDRAADDSVPAQLAFAHGAAVTFEVPNLDGGAIISNGFGLCVMTEASLEEAGFIKRRHRRRFATHLGCRGLAVIPELPNETTGHIDVVAQFLGAHTLAFSQMTGAEGELLDVGLSIIRETAAAIGQELHVERVPMVANGDVFYSYVNGTRVGDRFLVPSYSAIDPKFQARAYDVLERAMPGVRLLAIDSDEMVSLGGAVHCITLGLTLPIDAPRCVPRPGSLSHAGVASHLL